MGRETSYINGSQAELICSAWLLGLGYQVFRNVSGGGPADLIAWNIHTDAKFVIDVKSRSSSNRSLTPSATKCRTKHSSIIHYLHVDDGKVIGFWRPREDGWPGSERYWPLDCADQMGRAHV